MKENNSLAAPQPESLPLDGPQPECYPLTEVVTDKAAVTDQAPAKGVK